VATEATVAAETPSSEGGGASTADLVGLIEGKSDEEIVELIKALGEDSFFGGLFDEMAKRFLPDKAAGKTAVIQYDINMPEGTKSYQIDVAGGACNVNHDAPKDATVTLILSAPDFLRLISGKLNGMSAFMSGKLKLKGDMMLAQTMQGWFDAS
jgi:putative sterol carrier protein